MRNNSRSSVPITTTTTTTTGDVSNLHGVYAIDEIMVDILSRLPAKSLMRFKCVSKSWSSLIQKNKDFFSLHSCRRSKSNKKILIQSCWEGTGRFLTLDLFKRSIEDVTTIPRTWERKRILGPVNGLLCFVNSLQGSVLIYNLCTKEESPWITSNFLKNKSNGLVDPLSGFGFDPVTQEHKVLLTWLKNDYQTIAPKDVICEVLTVGENTWRTTKQVLPITNFDWKDPIYLNGSIYWLILNYMNWEEWLDEILVFDVGKEKFRLIIPPNGIRYRFNREFILEVDGQLAIMERMVCNDQKKVTKMRVWTYKEEGENNYKWSREMIELPFCFEKNEIRIIKSIPGKDLFMITSNILIDLGEPPLIYFYDMKKKKLTEYGSLPRPDKKFEESFILLVLEESIYPVGAQLPVPDHHDKMITTSPPPPPLVDTEEWSNTSIVISVCCFYGLFSALNVFRKEGLLL